MAAVSLTTSLPAQSVADVGQLADHLPEELVPYRRIHFMPPSILVPDALKGAHAKGAHATQMGEVQFLVLASPVESASAFPGGRSSVRPRAAPVEQRASAEFWLVFRRAEAEVVERIAGDYRAGQFRQPVA